MSQEHPLGARARLDSQAGQLEIYRLDAIEKAGLGRLDRLPFTIRILLESALRNLDGRVVTEDHVRQLANWQPRDARQAAGEVPFHPSRVILQDFTGVPCVVDLAAMRSALRRAGKDPRKVNPLVPVDLVIDHSVQVDEYGSAAALLINAEKEFERNRERYQFLAWGQKAFDNFRVVPPATGIVHQVNLEYLATVVAQRNGVAMPDTLVGTDSHTTMINGLGVLGWGVGGIEAEAVMLAQPIYLLMPQVVGFKLHGQLPEGATATDLVLLVTQMLRAKGVVDKFVEFYGPGLSAMSLADRATLANMAPEYGATCGFFPVDDETLGYLRRTARPAEVVDLVERYCKEQGLFRSDATPAPEYSDVLELDLASVEPSLAGPRRPQDRIALTAMKAQWRQDLSLTYKKVAGAGGTSTLRSFINEGGQTRPEDTAVAAVDPGIDGVPVEYRGQRFALKHGAVVIAAITSCTNTSNPSVMLAAGLVARKAVARGLASKPWVKTSLAPGSRVVTDYLRASGLQDELDELGFQVVGYGCTTCIGNSGPLPEPIAQAVQDNDLVVAAVLSGNRNFEGRINQHVKANYLASPPLVVAYALAGTVDIDFESEPIGRDGQGQQVYLRDLWPTQEEIARAVSEHVVAEQFRRQYGRVFEGSEQWNRVQAGDSGDVYRWDESSTYIQEPPYFVGMPEAPLPVRPVERARALAVLGDSVTTDHISPAGSIKKDSPAGQYLVEHGVPPHEFNSYGSRRGNDRVMTRGTFANIRVRNMLAAGKEGGYTTYLGPARGSDSDPDAGRVMSIFDAAMKYQAAGVPLCVLAGKDYGMGSSRDWAAKGTLLLGVRFVLAESFERIHRSNLVGMGVLPLQFVPGQDRQSLNLTGHEVFSLEGLDDSVRPQQRLTVVAHDAAGEKRFEVVCRLDTPVEVDYYRAGGILPHVLRRLAR
ncbi:MAG: aconitate hydratase AcnA [Acidobacteria bacterium]|nr:aconitate hydratase AcnA [Acidobacteriota bacterium]